MFKKLLFTGLIVALTAMPSLAGSLMGATGLFNIPTADVLPLGMTGASVYVENDRITGAISHGLMDFLEVGAALRFEGGQAVHAAPFIKGQLFAETARDPGVAAGIEDRSAFVVLSKMLAPRLRGHVGVGTGRFHGLFGGITYVVNPVVVSRPNGFQPPRVMLIGEYDGRYPNLGARLSFAQGLDIDVALARGNDLMIGAAWRTRF